MKKKSSGLNRRDFLKTSAIAGIGISAMGIGATGCENISEQNNTSAVPSFIKTQPKLPNISPIPVVKIGFVGVGAQGSNHVRNFLNIEGVEVKAICDVVPEKVERMQKWAVKAGQKKPAAYSNGENDFVRMCENEDLDLVFTATPWKWHVPVAKAAMKNGKHIAIEVPAALTINECWELIDYAEKYNKHCVMMENVNYGEREMLVLNMVRKGLFGEILHGEGAYNHDLRNYKTGGTLKENWRVKHSVERDGNIYPTHGLGPIANAMNINRGDRFDYLVSMSSKVRGLNLYAKEHLGEDNEFANIDFALGDVNVSMIKTVNGATITLYHITNLPTPYSRIDFLQGTKAASIGYPNRIHIDGVSPAHQWEELEKYEEEHQHSLWKNISKIAKGDLHGGMDFLEDYRLVQALQTGTPTDMDVYDAAALSVVAELSEISVANRSRPVDFPDFTRGMWKKRNPLVIPEL